MFMNRKTHHSIFILVLLMLFLFSCRLRKNASEEASVVRTPVTIVPVAFKSVTSAVALPATATYMNKSIIRATTTGNIENIMISPGEFISAGQLLFTIKTREAMALDKKAVQDSSLNFKGLITIFSPKEGVINSISYQKGDFVQEGDEMAVVSEVNSLVFILDVPFEFDSYIKNNRNCKITLPDNRQINGNITEKLPEMELQSQTVKYIVKLQSHERIPGNLIASISIIKSTNEKAIVLPKKAVLGDETQTKFWVMKLLNDSTAIKTVVTKGFENNDEVEITSPGFLPSDRILLTGNYGLPDTAKVTIIKE
jgi:biotin carboxyl carrier protein